MYVRGGVIMNLRRSMERAISRVKINGLPSLAIMVRSIEFGALEIKQWVIFTLVVLYIASTRWMYWHIKIHMRLSFQESSCLLMSGT